MVKVLFIYPNLTGQEASSVGISILSACIKEKGHESFLMDYTWGGNFNDCIKKIREVKPHLIAFSLRSGEYNFCLALANKIKQIFDILIIFGGVHPTVDPEDVIKKEQVDMICIGEGEYALVELLERMEKGMSFVDVKNLWVKEKGKIIRNPLRPLIDIDKLPFMDRELFDYQRYLTAGDGRIEVWTSRGCPFSCAYCINNSYHKIFKNKYVRLRNPKKVIEEINLLKKKYNIKSIQFRAESFTFNKKWLKEFCKLYSKQINLPFACEARADNIDDEICSYLKKANCYHISLGVESGNEKLRIKILKKHITNEQIIAAFTCLKQYGIKTYSMNIVGIPFETEKEYWDTVKLNRILKPDYLQASILQPYPSTEIYKLCIEKGFLKEGITLCTGLYNRVLEYPDVSKGEIWRRQKYFRFRVFRAYNFKKALISLLFDFSYPVYWKLRPKIPLRIKKVILKVKNKIEYCL